tara:strand:- start:3763 stop:4989 length:1227 start_codon:yes stop_codon:yes gene_type:complete
MQLRTYALTLLMIFITTTTIAQVLSYEIIDTFDQKKLEGIWAKGKIPKPLLEINYDVVVYDIIYQSHWVNGEPIKASGLYFAPVTEEAFPIMVYNHGTRIRKQRSNSIRGENLISMIFATDGYGVIMPDYFGLGHGDKVHLYCHADSEADAGIDFLKIIDKFNKKHGHKRNEEIFITGYSQGGHACLALHKKLQKEYSDEFPVKASSPMSGPYDLAVTQAEVMYQEYSQPHYLPYLLIGTNAAYNIWPQERFYKIFKNPYDTIIPELFTGDYSYADINAALPSIPKNMIIDELNHQYENNPDYLFKKIMVDNSVDDWKPNAPIQFCYCEADEEVKYENSLVAYDKMKANGAKHLYLRSAGKQFGHRACADYALVYTKFFFDSFRKGSKKGRKGPLHKRILLGIAKKFR